MRITIVTGPFYPAPAIQGGSTNRIWCGFASEFAKTGHTVTVVACKHPDQPDSEVLDGVQFQRVHGYRQTGTIGVDLAKDLAYAIQTLPKLPPADITVINDFWLPVLSVLRKTVTGKTVVVVGRYPKKQFWLYKSADLFVPLSSAIEHALHEQAPWTVNRTAVVPYSFDPDCFNVNSAKPYAERSPTILYAGRIHPEKGLDLLLKAFRVVAQTFPDATLQIMGPHEEHLGGGGQQFFGQLQALAEGLSVEWIAASFAPSTLAERYKETKVFCYPSTAEKGETFGASALEAMACGCLTIVSALECFKDFVRPDENGLVFNHRSTNAVEQLAQSLRRALESNTINQQLAGQAQQDAALLSYPEVAKKHLAHFEALL